MTSEKHDFVPPQFGRGRLPEEEVYREARTDRNKTEDDRRALYEQMVKAREQAQKEAGELPPELEESAVLRYIELATKVTRSRSEFLQAEGEEKERLEQIFLKNKAVLDKYLDNPQENFQLERALKKWKARQAERKKEREQENAQTEIKTIGINAEISEKDWREIKEHLEDLRRKKDWGNLAMQAMLVKIVSPEKISEFNFDEESIVGIKQHLRVLRALGDWRGVSRQVMAQKLLFPDQFSKTGLEDSDWQKMSEHLEKLRRKKDWRSFSWQAMRMKIISPEKSSAINLDSASWFGMQKNLEKSKRVKIWEDFSSRASIMALLFPQRKSLLGLNNEARYGMKNNLDRLRASEPKDWRSFLWQAMEMKILGAKEVKITDNGIEFSEQN